MEEPKLPSESREEEGLSELPSDVPPDQISGAPHLPGDFEQEVPPNLPPETSPYEENVERVIPPTPPSQPPPAPPARPAVPEPMDPSSERTWAMVAHLSILLNLITGILGPVVALVIYLAYKDRSRYVAYQAMQSFVFQLVFFVGAGLLAALLWIITIPLMIVLIGCVCAPLAILVSFIPALALVYGVVAAVQTSHGEDFRYWLVGDWVMPKEGSPGVV